MRVLLERSGSARCAVAVLATLLVLALVRSAAADDDFGLRRLLFGIEPEAPVVATIPVLAPPRRHRARRIWAAAESRPLRIALKRHSQPDRRPFARHPSGSATGRRHASAEPQVVFPKLVSLPKPPRPALVSIYQDHTLRGGDAVMMADGIHVFHGAGVWPFRPRDFVPLKFVTALDWHLRQTLDDLDRGPPTRWSSMGATAG